MPSPDSASAAPSVGTPSGERPSELGGSMAQGDNPYPTPRTRESRAYERGAIAGFNAGYKLGLQEGARMACEQMANELHKEATE